MNIELLDYLSQAFYEDFADSIDSANELSLIAVKNWDKVCELNEGDYYDLFAHDYESVFASIQVCMESKHFVKSFMP